MKKRILIVSQHFWPENFRISDIAAGFLEKDIEVDVLCGLPNYPHGNYYEGYRYTSPRRQTHNGIEIFRCGEIRRKGNTGLRIFLNYISFPFFALFNLHRLKSRHYDAVFCYETSPVYMILPAIAYAKKHKIPLTTYVLDLWPENLYSVLPIKNKFLRSLAKKSADWHYRRCDKLIALTPGMAQRLGEIKPKKNAAPPDICVIPQYCEDFYTQDIHDDALHAKYKDSFNIVFTGNISPAQDLDNLINALDLLKNSGSYNIRCLIVGDGMSKAALQETVKSKKLEDTVIFCGSFPAEDMPRWTGVASALYLGLAASENLGLTVPAKLQSYCASGRPILAALSDEAAKAAAGTGAALVSPSGDATALAENIKQLYHLPEHERRALGENGHAYYQAHYRRSLLLQNLLDYILP